MKIENLEVGMELKNYKHLCEVLEIEVKNGKSKVAQIKEIERFFKYNKDGNKFKIVEIYNKPLPPNNNITKYIPLIEQLIMHIIVTKSNKGKLYINKSNLHKTLKMINEEYTTMKYRRINLVDNYNLPKEVVEDFYNTSDDLLERNINQALKSLEKQSLIKSSEVISVCQYVIGDKSLEEGKLNKLKYEHRKATDKEVRLILKLQREVMDELECYDLQDVYSNGKAFEFYKKINDYLFEHYNIKYYYTSYELIYNKKHINKAYNDEKLYIMDDESYYLTSRLLNSNISFKLNNLAIKRSAKAKTLDELSLTQYLRTSDQYIEQIKLLINELIVVK